MIIHQSIKSVQHTFIQLGGNHEQARENTITSKKNEVPRDIQRLHNSKECLYANPKHVNFASSFLISTLFPQYWPLCALRARNCTSFCCPFYACGRAMRDKWRLGNACRRALDTNRAYDTHLTYCFNLIAHFGTRHTHTHTYILCPFLRIHPVLTYLPTYLPTQRRIALDIQVGRRNGSNSTSEPLIQSNVNASLCIEIE